MACKQIKNPDRGALLSDRDAQFEYLNAQTLQALARGHPVLSVDAKKKENLGNFKNNAQTYRLMVRRLRCWIMIFT